MNNKDVQLSKKLSWILRHGAVKERVPISPDGYIELEVLLQHPSFSGCSRCDIVRVVHSDTKQRFKLQVNPQSNKEEIKANQGHSIQVTDAGHTPIVEAKYETVVHGTYLKFWPQIKVSGLSRMTRRHIHFAKGTLTDHTIISGIRANAQLYIFINLHDALKDGYKFFESQNGVILTPGNVDGLLPINYFKDVVEVNTGIPDAVPSQEIMQFFLKFGMFRVIKMQTGMAILLYNKDKDAQQLLQTPHYKLGPNVIHVRRVEAHRAMRGFKKITKPITNPENVKATGTRKKKENNLPTPDCDIIKPTTIDLSGDFEKQVENILASIRLTSAEINNTLLLYKQLEMMLQTHWPECKAYPFGSMTTGLAIKTSDADCFIALPQHVREPGDPRNIVKARNVLSTRPEIFAELVAIPQANTPIVKFLHKPTNVRCDVSMKNCLSLRNSELIKYLLQTDERLTQIALLLKYWGQVHGLTGTGRLTNYALVMMYIFYLQQPHVNVLPSVRSLRSYPVYVECWDTSFTQSATFANKADNISVPQLLGGFFQYYSAFNYNKYVVCPFLGVPVERKCFKSGDLPEGFELYKENLSNNYCYPLKLYSSMCVQDPFEQSRNVAACITGRFASQLLKYFEFAADMYKRATDEDHAIFLRDLLLTKPKIISPKDIMCQVMIPTRFLVVPEMDDEWQNRIRDAFTCVLLKILKMGLVSQSEKRAKDRLHVTYKVSMVHSAWTDRQNHYEACKMANPNASFLELQQGVTECVLKENDKKLNSTLMVHLMMYSLHKVVTTYNLISGEDHEEFSIFSTFMRKNVGVWCRELIKEDNSKRCPIKKKEADGTTLLESIETKMDDKCAEDSRAHTLLQSINVANNKNNNNNESSKTCAQKKTTNKSHNECKVPPKEQITTWYCKKGDKRAPKHTQPAPTCNGETETVKPDVAAFLNNLAKALKSSPHNALVPIPSETASQCMTTSVPFKTCDSVCSGSSAKAEESATSTTDSIAPSVHSAFDTFLKDIYSTDNSVSKAILKENHDNNINANTQCDHISTTTENTRHLASTFGSFSLGPANTANATSLCDNPNNSETHTIKIASTPCSNKSVSPFQSIIKKASPSKRLPAAATKSSPVVACASTFQCGPITNGPTTKTNIMGSNN